MSTEAESATEGAPLPGFFRRFAGLAGGYWTDRETRWAAIALSLGLVVLGIAQIGMAVWLNFWNKAFFGALEAKDWDAFVKQIAVFAMIVVFSAFTVSTHLRVKRRLQLNWRQWLSHRMIGRWLNEGRQYQLLFMPGEHDNPDGRIAEDIRISTELAVEFAHSILHCVLLLVSFLSILWSLSDAFTLRIGTFALEIPGYMVWVAIGYAGVGSLLTFLLGRPLVRATDARQSREADFRFGLVRARENAEGVALLRGEADERNRLVSAFDGIRAAWNWQTTGQRRLMLLTNSYTTLATAFPLIIAAPRYFAGTLGLGGLMQTAQAFLQVQSALSWFVDNFPRFAEWRASAERVLSLHQGLADLEEDVASVDEHTITVTDGVRPVLVLRNLVIAHPDGNVLVSDATGEFKPGERTLIKGESGSGKSTLFRAVASLWPWGQGAIELPTGAQLMFMPQRPYLPVGTLRTALLYPAAADAESDEAIKTVLGKVGLADFAERLDEEAQWDRVLSGGEQQRVGFARMLLHKPDWVFLDEATAALDEANQDKMMNLLIEELPDAGVLSVGHRPGLEAFHQRELVLVRGEDGARLTKASRARREAQRALQATAKKRRGNVVGRLRVRFKQRGKRQTDLKLTPP